jgi:hypothetical protein
MHWVPLHFCPAAQLMALHTVALTDAEYVPVGQEPQRLSDVVVGASIWYSPAWQLVNVRHDLDDESKNPFLH